MRFIDVPKARRFVDANIFLYAFLKTERKLSEDSTRLKRASKYIIQRIENGERVLTSVVHLAETSNILESMTSDSSTEIVESILLNENIEIAEVDKEIYTTAIELAKIYKISLNDCVAVVIMKTHGVSEIYSFDDDFDKIDGIARVEK